MKYKIRVYTALLILAFPGFLSVVFPMLSGDSKIELRKLQDFPSFPKTQDEFASWPSQFDQFGSVVIFSAHLIRPYLLQSFLALKDGST